MDESKVPHLIDEVQRRPAIWNKSLSEHNNKNFIGSEWNKVAANINVSKASAQNKWKALVKKFKTEHSRVLLHRSGDGLEDVYKSAWPYYVSLSFLAHYTVPNSSSGNLNCLFELKPSITDKSSNESLQSSDLNSNQDSHMMNKKEKDIAEEILRMENQKFALLEKSACHNPQANNSVEQDKLNMAFFETLLPILREVSKEDILLCRTDISRVVFNYAYKDVVWKSLSDSSKPANESSPIPPKIRKFDDDDDCQIIGSFKLPTNISVKVEKKYQPSTKERDIERQNFNNNDMASQRYEYGRRIFGSRPLLNWDPRYHNQQSPPEFYGQHNYQPMEHQNWYAQGAMSRQPLVNMTHLPNVGQGINNGMGPVANNINVGSSDKVLYGRLEDSQTSTENQSIVTTNVMPHVVRSETTSAANNLTTQSITCSAEATMTSNTNVVNAKTLFYDTQGHPCNKENKPADIENCLFQNSLNVSSSSTPVTGNNTAVSDGAVNFNNSI